MQIREDIHICKITWFVGDYTTGFICRWLYDWVHLSVTIHLVHLSMKIQYIGFICRWLYCTLGSFVGQNIVQSIGFICRWLYDWVHLSVTIHWVHLFVTSINWVHLSVTICTLLLLNYLFTSPHSSEKDYTTT